MGMVVVAVMGVAELQAAAAAADLVFWSVGEEGVGAYA